MCFVPPDHDFTGVQHLAQLISYEIDGCLKIKLSSQSLLDTIDHAQLCCTLLGYFEQALSFIKEMSIFKGRT